MGLGYGFMVLWVQGVPVWWFRGLWVWEFRGRVYGFRVQGLGVEG